MKKNIKMIYLTFGGYLILVYLIFVMLATVAHINHTTASDYEWYCRDKHYARIDYAFPSWPISCWLNEEVK